MADWLTDFGEFPASVVADACTAWRKSRRTRPTPADLLDLVREHMPRQAALPRPYDPNEPQWLRDHRAAIAARVEELRNGSAR